MDMDYIKGLLNSKNDNNEFKKSGEGGRNRYFDLPREVKEGASLIRVLPAWKGGKAPGKIVFKHWGVPGFDKWAAFCYKTHRLSNPSESMECPICKVLSEFKGKADIDKFVPSEHSSLNVLVIKDDRQDKKTIDRKLPHILTTSPTMFYWILEQILNPEVGDITDPKFGHNVTVKREKDGGAFSRVISLKPSSIGDSEEEIQQILNNTYNLDEIFRTPDDEYHKKMLEGAKQIRILLENSLMKSGGNLPPKENKPSYEPSNTPSPSNTANSGVIKPPGAPTCFSDKSVFVKEEDRDGSKGKTCDLCPVEHECATQISKL